jgi:hypothetical protein
MSPADLFGPGAANYSTQVSLAPGAINAYGATTNLATTAMQAGDFVGSDWASGDPAAQASNTNPSMVDQVTRLGRDIWGDPVGKEVVKKAGSTLVSEALSGEGDQPQRSFAPQQSSYDMNTELATLITTLLAAGAGASSGGGSSPGVNPTFNAATQVPLGTQAKPNYLTGSRGVAVDPKGTMMAMNMPAQLDEYKKDKPTVKPITGAVRFGRRPAMYV